MFCGIVKCILVNVMLCHFQGNNKVKGVAGMLNLMSTKAKQAQQIAGNKQPPSMWAQLKEQGRTN